MTSSDASAGKALLTRILPLVVLVLAGWVVARNVSWRDTLSAGGVRVEGEVLGDWRAEVVEFRVDAGQVLAPKPVPEGAAEDSAEARRAEAARVLAPLALEGGDITVRPDALLVGDDVLLTGGAVRKLSAQPGIPTALEGVDPFGFLPAILCLVLASLCVVTRWWRLLNVEGCRVRWTTAFRFTYVGLFFNAFIPGINGGDVARAVAVVRDQPENRTSALMTVVVDRLFGLVGMVLLAAVVVLTGDERMDPLKLPVVGFAAAMLVGLFAYLNPALRRLLRIETLLSKLPGGERLAKIDDVATRLLGQPAEALLALALSFGNHVGNAGCVVLAAGALGSSLGIHDWLSIMTISNTIAAAPISPGGLGVGEVFFGSLSELLGGTYVLGVATSLLYRVGLLVMGALGGLVMVLGGRKLRETVAEARAAALEEA